MVCIADLGPGGAHGGTDEDVWEVRFKVTRSAGDFAVPVDSCGDGTQPCYGSLFVQDNGTPGTLDMADENFDSEFLGDDRCGLALAFDLEPVLAGNFTAHIR